MEAIEITHEASSKTDIGTNSKKNAFMKKIEQKKKEKGLPLALKEVKVCSH